MTEELLTDEELTNAVRNGDLSAARTLVTRHQSSIYGHALRMLRDREDAADVTQEAMVRALSNIHRYDPARPFAPWIHRIARNLCVDRYRRRRPTSELKEEITSVDPMTRQGRPADEVAHQAHLNQALSEAMEDLGDKYREIIELYHFKHLNYREIAEHLDLPDGTVMNRLFRARKKLQAALLERGIRP